MENMGPPRIICTVKVMIKKLVTQLAIFLWSSQSVNKILHHRRLHLPAFAECVGLAIFWPPENA